MHFSWTSYQCAYEKIVNFEFFAKKTCNFRVFRDQVKMENLCEIEFEQLQCSSIQRFSNNFQWVSFVILITLVIINTYVAVLLKNTHCADHCMLNIIFYGQQINLISFFSHLSISTRSSEIIIIIAYRRVLLLSPQSTLHTTAKRVVCICFRMNVWTWAVIL